MTFSELDSDTALSLIALHKPGNKKIILLFVMVKGIRKKKKEKSKMSKKSVSVQRR